MKRLAILFVLVAAVWGGYSLLPEPQTPPARPAVDWPRLAPEQLLAVEAVAGNATFRLEKEQGAWFLQAEGPAPRLRADRAKVESLANFFNANPPRRSLGEIDLSDRAQAKAYGLDVPEKQLTLADNAARHHLIFGAKNPAGDAVYATLASTSDTGNRTATVYLLGVNWLEQAIAADKYQDLRLTDLLAQNITRILVDNGDNPLELERSGPAQYRFLQPQGYAEFKVSSLDAEHLLHEVATLKGQLADPASQNGLAENATALLSLSLWPLGSQTPQQLRFYPIPGDRTRYLVQSDWQPALLQVDRAALLKLAPDPFLLRDRRVLTFDPAAVERQTLTFFAAKDLTSSQVVLIRGNGTRPAEDMPSRDWTRLDSNATVAGLDMLLWQLSEIAFEADPVRERPASALDVVRWTLQDANGTALNELTFARDEALPEGQCWLIARPGQTDETGSETFYPVADDILQRAEDAVLHGGNASDY